MALSISSSLFFSTAFSRFLANDLADNWHRPIHPMPFSTSRSCRMTHKHDKYLVFAFITLLWTMYILLSMSMPMTWLCNWVSLSFLWHSEQVVTRFTKVTVGPVVYSPRDESFIDPVFQWTSSVHMRWKRQSHSVCERLCAHFTSGRSIAWWSIRKPQITNALVSCVCSVLCAVCRVMCACGLWDVQTVCANAEAPLAITVLM